MKNQLIRETAKESGVRFWEIADKLGIQESQLSKKMRYELSEEETNKIIDCIKEIAANR